MRNGTSISTSAASDRPPAAMGNIARNVCETRLADFAMKLRGGNVNKSRVYSVFPRGVVRRGEAICFAKKQQERTSNSKALLSACGFLSFQTKAPGKKQPGKIKGKREKKDFIPSIKLIANQSEKRTADIRIGSMRNEATDALHH